MHDTADKYILALKAEKGFFPFSYWPFAESGVRITTVRSEPEWMVVMKGKESDPSFTATN